MCQGETETQQNRQAVNCDVSWLANKKELP